MNSSKTTRLEIGWKIKIDPENIGYKNQWHKGTTPVDVRIIPVPGIIQQIFPGYHGVAWYWLNFTPKHLPAYNERILICFGAVDYFAEIWLNGEYIGKHEGGETPFDFDITSQLRQDADNILTVRVINPTNESIDGFVLNETPHYCKEIPHRVGASYNYGGITMPVEIRIQPMVAITGIFTKTDIQNGLIKAKVYIYNHSSNPFYVNLSATVGCAVAEGSSILSINSDNVLILSGKNETEIEMYLDSYQLWSPDNPNLYKMSVQMETKMDEETYITHNYSVRFGFRDFRVGEDGYFLLNGKRIFLKSSHTVNHYPIGQGLSPTPDLLKRDLLYAKTAGFNTVRFIARMAFPEQLDYCDEIGLMVYEETYAAWNMADSQYLASRYDSAVTEMIIRDRNHASIVIWGLLNENLDNPTFRRAVGILPLLRSLDDSRLVILGSGRWDAQHEIGSVSNPGTTDWQHFWGIEELPEKTTGSSQNHVKSTYRLPSGALPDGYIENSGDAHVYPLVPTPNEGINFIRSLGHGTKPVFLSEYGTGSMVNAIQVTRKYEQVGADLNLEDSMLYRSMADRYMNDWVKYGMEGVFPFPEDMLNESQKIHAKWRTQGFDAIRSNPNICGYNLTGMVDQGMAGEGLWTTWRDLKPGVMDVLNDGLSPLRWCLFVNPMHVYSGTPFRVEAILANENILGPGEYPVKFKIWRQGETLWEKSFHITIPEPGIGESLPLAFPVISEEVIIDGPSDAYCFAACMEKGGAPSGGRLDFHITDSKTFPEISETVVTIGINDEVKSWLFSHRVRCRDFSEDWENTNEVILVGAIEDGSVELPDWKKLVRRVAAGSVAIFLTPTVFMKGDNPTGWLPLSNKGTSHYFHNWLYHREDIAKKHPVFDGLKSGGIMDWDYYGQVTPYWVYDNQDAPDTTIVSAFAVGYTCSGGYSSGLITGLYELGNGWIMLNTLRIMENLNKNPAADRLLLNMISHSSSLKNSIFADNKDEYETILCEIGLISD